MPFRSKKQMKACFASNGFNGKIDCKEWARETKNTKDLPEKKQIGGFTNQLQYKEDPYTWMQLQTDTRQRPRTEEEELLLLQQNPPANKKRGFNPMSIGLGMQAAGTGLNWLSGVIERGRQNQYMYSQLATLGQLDAVPVEDYQPNPFSLYARYGGSLKKWMKKKK